MNHVLYLSYDGMADPLGQSQVLPYLEGLVSKGHKFSLISFEFMVIEPKTQSYFEEGFLVQTP